jgi:hypothetical protein
MHIHDAPLSAATDDLGAELERNVRRIADTTDDRPLADAVQVLRTELVKAGFAFDDRWCRTALNAIRGGRS